MLELAILGLLKEQELHGYELKKRLAETLGAGSGVSFGSLYPALARLEAAGAVKAVEANDVGVLIPGTGSLGGELAAFRARKQGTRGSRGKKVYGITERGELLFDELLIADSASSDDERLFHLRLAFARYLPHDARLGLLERRRAYLLEQLARTTSAIRNGWERLDAYTRSLIEHGNETTEHDISWLDRLIATERETEPAGDRAGGSTVAKPATTTRAGKAAPSTQAEHTAPPNNSEAEHTAPPNNSEAEQSAPTIPAPPAATQEGTTP